MEIGGDRMAVLVCLCHSSRLGLWKVRCERKGSSKSPCLISKIQNTYVFCFYERIHSRHTFFDNTVQKIS